MNLKNIVPEKFLKKILVEYNNAIAEDDGEFIPFIQVGIFQFEIYPDNWEPVTADEFFVRKLIIYNTVTGEQFSGCWEEDFEGLNISI